MASSVAVAMSARCREMLALVRLLWLRIRLLSGNAFYPTLNPDQLASNLRTGD